MSLGTPPTKCFTATQLRAAVTGVPQSIIKVMKLNEMIPWGRNLEEYRLNVESVIQEFDRQGHQTKIQ